MAVQKAAEGSRMRPAATLQRAGNPHCLEGKPTQPYRPANTLHPGPSHTEHHWMEYTTRQHQLRIATSETFNVLDGIPKRQSCSTPML